MKTTKSLFGIVTITAGLLALLTAGCGKEYPASLVRTNFPEFNEWKPTQYYDKETEKTIDGFLLPDKAVFVDDYPLKSFNFNDHGEIGLGSDLTRYYWNVRFIGTKKYSEDNKDYIRFRFEAKNKKSPDDIKKFLFLWKSLGYYSSEMLTREQIEKAKADFVKQYGDSDFTALIQKINDSQRVVMATYAGASRVVKEITPAQQSSGSSWGSGDERKLVGIYQSVKPPYVLKLSYGGKVTTQNLESNDSNTGKWLIRNGTLVTIWDSNQSETEYVINADGSFKSRHGILFVKTQQ